MRRCSLAFAVAVGVALLGAPRPASACKCHAESSAVVSTPVWHDDGLRLVRETIELDCEEPMLCHWRSTHVYAHDGATEIHGVVESPRLGSGRPLSASVSFAGQVLQPRAPEAGDCESGLVDTDAPDCEQVYELAGEYEAGELVLVIELELELPVQFSCSCVLDGARARHLVLGEAYRRADVAVERHQLEDHAETEVRMAGPRGWTLRPNIDESARRGPIAVTFPAPHGLVLSLDRDPVDHGPLLGVGVGFGDRGFGLRPQLRAGWEVLGSFVGGSLVVESDVRETVALVPLFEGFTPAPAVGPIPSAGLGVGLPVMLVPEARPGFRLQATLSWAVVSVLGVFDVYPGGTGWAQALRGAAMVQLSI